MPFKIQLLPSWVSQLTEELEAEIVERQAEASERRVVLTRRLARLADERGKLLQAFYATGEDPGGGRSKRLCYSLCWIDPRRLSPLEFRSVPFGPGNDPPRPGAGRESG